MSSFNDAIAKCLDILYEYSSNFKVSMELVQHLAQQLKLETFIDSMNFTTSDNANTQRLSIAGSSILIDIDFVSDREIVSVSLSQGSNDEKSTIGEPISMQTGNYNNVTLDITKSTEVNGFLTSSGESSAESILINNLKCDTLGNFASNLQYLGTIDTLSSAGNVNLFSFLEKVALLLKTVSELEGVGKSEDTNINEGYVSKVGRVLLNDHSTNRLGLILKFWKDYRNSTDTEGKEYSLQVKLSEATPTIEANYFPLTDPWEIQGQFYKFDILGASLSSSGWLLALSSNESFQFPVTLIEYWGVPFKSNRNNVNKILETLNDNIDYEATLEDVPFKFMSEIIDPQFGNVTEVSVNKIEEIAQLIPALRNFCVLKNICEELTKSCCEKEASASKDKLRDSLKLSTHVTDEELIGLQQLTSKNNFENNPLRRYSEVESIMEGEAPEISETKADFINLSFASIDFAGECDLHFRLEARIEGYETKINFKIANGVACSIAEETSMEDDKSEKFIETLNATENLHVSLKSIFTHGQ